MLLGVIGISQIRINDNPVHWFAESHDIRIADDVLNERFNGTYMSYLAFSPEDGFPMESRSPDILYQRFQELHAALIDQGADPHSVSVIGGLQSFLEESRMPQDTVVNAIKRLEAYIRNRLKTASQDTERALLQAQDVFDEILTEMAIFKQPALLEWLSDLQQQLTAMTVVGRTTLIADIIKAVHCEMLDGLDSEYRIPDSTAGVAQTLLTYQNSHQADDIRHFVDFDYRNAVIWIQLKRGDNIDMTSVARFVDDYIVSHPPPVSLSHNWFGLTHINRVWQDKMVTGMRNALAGSLVAVLLSMIVMLRSVLWAILAMIPLTISITLIYGVIGIIGKDYDMPVAVLSSLSLGLAIDFAIQFLVRVRKRIQSGDRLEQAVMYCFDRPASAILRNAIIVSVGFLPLLAAPLVPYNTVGTLIATILVLSAAATLLLLPALLKCAVKEGASLLN